MLTSRLPEIAAALRPALEAALKEAADDIAQSAKDRVPVATGKLRDAIHTDERPEGIYVVAGDHDVFYGHMVEHGTSHSPPHPFLVPAFEDERDKALELAAGAIEDVIR